MVTIKEIASQLGVSMTTVSNVIHGKTSEVSPATIEMVQKALKESGYVPNMGARNLAQNQSKIIGVVMKERKGRYTNLLCDPFYGELVGAIEKIIRTKDYYLMMNISDNMQDTLKNAATWNVDGVIMVSLDYEDVLELRKSYKKPMVLIDCYNCPEDAPEINITLDEQKGAFDVTEYLIRSGHSRLAYFAYGTEGIAGERYKGCVRALKEYGLPWDQESFPVISIGEMGLEGAMEAVCFGRDAYTAVICGSDYYAARLINYIEDHGIRVPDDLSVTGFDDNEYARLVRPHLTTVRQSVTEKGMRAVRILLDLMNGRTYEEHNIRLPFKMVVRDSVRVLR